MANQDSSENISCDVHNDSELVINALNRLVKSSRATKQILFISQSVLIAIATFFLIVPLEMETLTQFIVVLMVSISFLVVKFRSHIYLAINTQNILEHCNRNFKDYQESAQLVLLESRNLSLLQQLQKEKIIEKLNSDITNGRISEALPGWPWKAFVFPLLFVAMALKLSLIVIPNFPVLTQVPSSKVLVENPENETQNKIPELISATINIVPPEYTQREAQTVEQLNLEVIEGSKVTWRLSFEQNDIEVLHWYFLDADDNKTELSKQKDGSYHLTLPMEKTTFYRFAYIDNLSESNQLIPLPEIYSLAIVKDQLPKIKIIEPNQSLVEIPQSEQAKFSIEVQVRDDFGIGEVSILASVAKGSGEAVKFRDETFQFDSKEILDDKQVYYKSWSLKSLNMEPGDEVYFSIIAFDNKQPTAQQSKSSSVIVRWLDDEVIETAAEGLQIRFIPEFFRSQRQIIIETEQLIADKKDLFPTVFKEKSVDLGFSQRDLKEKYGQYLGDEFGEGPAPDTVEMHGIADGYHGGEDVAQGEATAGLASHLEHLQDKENHNSHANEPNHNHAEAPQAPEAGHSHDHATQDPFGQSMVDSSDLSGASELIAQFAHNHGSAEIGPLSKRDPKSWMKRAVSVMWQAEMHLMMHEPEKALPYEYEAYQYLKLARQADKIYVKRLGFEPPPVKESARLTGELKDILTYELSVEDKIDSAEDAVIIQQAFQILNDPDMQKVLSKPAKKQLSELRDRLLELSNARPTLITYAATVEKILVAGSLELTKCENCLVDLKAKLWQLASRPISLPNIREQVLVKEKENYNSDVIEYLNEVNKFRQINSGRGTK